VLTFPSRAFPRFGGHLLFAIISTGEQGCISLTRCETSFKELLNFQGCYPRPVQYSKAKGTLQISNSRTVKTLLNDLLTPRHRLNRMHMRTRTRTHTYVGENCVKEKLKNMLKKTKNPQISIISTWVRCLYGLWVIGPKIGF
jgi:hypothetical protein